MSEITQVKGLFLSMMDNHGYKIWIPADAIWHVAEKDDGLLVQCLTPQGERYSYSIDPNNADALFAWLNARSPEEMMKAITFKVAGT